MSDHIADSITVRMTTIDESTTVTTSALPQQQARSIIKSHRSFSSHEPSSSLQSTSAYTSQANKHHRLETLAEVPSSSTTTTANQTQPKSKLFQRLVRQKMATGFVEHPFHDVRDTDTLTSSDGILSLGEVPTSSALLKQNNASSGDRRRSFSVIETFGPGGTKTTTTDSNMREYIKQTSKWRSMRGELNLPPEVRLKLENRRQPLSFKNIALGVLSDVGSKNTRHHNKQLLRMEPTYQLGPRSHCKQFEMEKIIHDILNAFISNIDPAKAEDPLASIRGSIEHLNMLIKARVKLILDPRYKIVVFSMLVDRGYQGVIAATKCLWDVVNDSGVTVREDFKNISIIINVFAVYHE